MPVWHGLHALSWVGLVSLYLGFQPSQRAAIASVSLLLTSTTLWSFQGLGETAEAPAHMPAPALSLCVQRPRACWPLSHKSPC